ncbi:SAF domain-containing protein [Brachybacterium sp. EF45031]|uniref:SAF domain-containing protein n=1 Tax=Brachybacterium sillae TaxID=2810536 RepID=UPI00217DDE3D|nr:SAF domain-containing protein [Brachybacterium sillae]MCS6712619.1 SAF domain-containing protein [Brachybacterium sillae]
MVAVLARIPWSHWRRALRRRRRLLTVLLLVLALAAVLPDLVPPSHRGVPVVVVREDLPARTALDGDDLTVRRVAPELAPAGSVTDPATVTGRRTVVPLPAGTPLQAALLEDSALVLPQGGALVVVPANPALAPHLGPGARVRIVPGPSSALGDAPPLPADGLEAVVVEVTTEAAGGAAPGLGSTSGLSVVVAVSADQGAAAAAAVSAGDASLVVVLASSRAPD